MKLSFRRHSKKNSIDVKVTTTTKKKKDLLRLPPAVVVVLNQHLRHLLMMHHRRVPVAMSDEGVDAGAASSHRATSALETVATTTHRRFLPTKNRPSWVKFPVKRLIVIHITCEKVHRRSLTEFGDLERHHSTPDQKFDSQVRFTCTYTMLQLHISYIRISIIHFVPESITLIS